MEWITIIFSSTLISVIITTISSYIMKTRTDELENITKKREEWRNKIQLIAIEIEQSSLAEIHIPLAKLKLNINAYGNLAGREWRDKKKLDFFKEEHIWQLIYLIEEDCIKNDDKKKFEEYRRTLIHFLSLLLKFDWEKSKQEIKKPKSLKISFCLFLLAIAIFLYEYCMQNISPVDSKKVIQNVAIMHIPYLISLIPYLFDTVKELRRTKWYKESTIMICSYCAALFCYIIMLMHCKIILSVDVSIIGYFYIGCIVIPMYHVIFQRSKYSDYENSICRLIKYDDILFYYQEFKWRYSVGIDFFSDYNINVGMKKLDDKFITEIFSKVDIVKIHETKKWKKIKKVARKRNMKVEDFLIQNPKYIDYMVCYKDKDKIELTIGKSKETWKRWIENSY